MFDCLPTWHQPASLVPPLNIDYHSLTLPVWSLQLSSFIITVYCDVIVSAAFYQITSMENDPTNCLLQTCVTQNSMFCTMLAISQSFLSSIV